MGVALVQGSRVSLMGKRRILFPFPPDLLLLEEMLTFVFVKGYSWRCFLGTALVVVFVGVVIFFFFAIGRLLALI